MWHGHPAHVGHPPRRVHGLAVAMLRFMAWKAMLQIMVWKTMPLCGYTQRHETARVAHLRRRRREMSRRVGISRRDFVKGLGAAVAAPTIVPASVFGRGDRPAPSERLTVGFIGVGKMANDYHLK